MASLTTLRYVFLVRLQSSTAAVSLWQHLKIERGDPNNENFDLSLI
jgi:hypothetical protein